MGLEERQNGEYRQMGSWPEGKGNVGCSECASLGPLADRAQLAMARSRETPRKVLLPTQSRRQGLGCTPAPVLTLSRVSWPRQPEQQQKQQPQRGSPLSSLATPVHRSEPGGLEAVSPAPSGLELCRSTPSAGPDWNLVALR